MYDNSDRRAERSPHPRGDGQGHRATRVPRFSERDGGEAAPGPSQLDHRFGDASAQTPLCFSSYALHAAPKGGLTMTILAGRSVLVTGASSGIGAATALEAARRGARVALLARTEHALARVAAGIRDLGAQAAVYPVDLSRAGELECAAANMQAQFGTPDVLINNAGFGQWLATDESGPNDAEDMMAVPYFAAFRLTRAFLPAMLARDSGVIVNVTSPNAFIPVPGSTTYTVARWAMRGFTQQLRADLRGTHLQVMLMVPGLVRSGYFDHNPGVLERIPRITRLYPSLTPSQVAAALLDGVEKSRRVVVVPPLMRFTLALHRVMPDLVDALVIGTGWSRNRGLLPRGEPDGQATALDESPEAVARR